MKLVIFSICVVLLIGITGFSIVLAEQTSTIPTWFKSNAKWWADGIISDSDFISGMQFLLNKKIISFSPEIKTEFPAVVITTEKTKYKTNEIITIQFHNVGTEKLFFDGNWNFGLYYNEQLIYSQPNTDIIKILSPGDNLKVVLESNTLTQMGQYEIVMRYYSKNYQNEYEIRKTIELTR